ncbi:MAG: hypothetical protein JXK07_09930 [Spirochaetes bacterium]|nr:hypothetical protein [Spirochaetota bacterium]MBN2771284.1 hypothetical protein [Spirochaetota bacterium]
MKANFDTEILGLDGNAIKENGKSVMLKSAVVNILMLTDPKAEETGEQKLKLFNLANKVMQCDAQTDYSAEELALIKERVGKYGTSLVVGRVFAAIGG